MVNKICSGIFFSGNFSTKSLQILSTEQLEQNSGSTGICFEPPIVYGVLKPQLLYVQIPGDVLALITMFYLTALVQCLGLCICFAVGFGCRGSSYLNLWQRYNLRIGFRK
jgi:hypothetical protein